MKNKRTLKLLILALVCSMCVSAVAPCFQNCDLVTYSYASEAGSYNQGSLISKKGKMTVNIKGARVVDVLSAIGVNMGYSIIYTGSDTTVDINIENATVDKVFDYVLSTLGLTAIESGNTIIVGTKENLKENFSDSLSFDRFDTTYVSTKIISQKIKDLGIPVSIIEMPNNEKSFWVQGLPQDIAKAREVMNVLDIADNGTEGTGANKGGKVLSSFYLKHISPTVFSRLLKSMGIDNTIAFYDDDDRFYIYGTKEEIDTIKNLQSILDRDKFYYFDEETSGSGTTKDGVTYKVAEISGGISKKDLMASISAICKDVNIVDPGSLNEKLLILVGPSGEVSSAEAIIKSLSGEAASAADGFGKVTLNSSVSASELERALKGIDFTEEVKFYVSNFGELTKTIFFYTKPYYVKEVEKAITTVYGPNVIANTHNGVNIPVYTGAKDELYKIKAVLSTLTGIESEKFQRVDDYNGTSILYLKGATPAEAELVDAMIKRIDDVKSTTPPASTTPTTPGAGATVSTFQIPAFAVGPSIKNKATVTFKIVGGAWSDDSTENKTVIVDFTDGKGTLKKAQIPTGMKASEGYKQDTGKWNENPNINENGITKDVTYTYSFENDNVEPTPSPTPPEGKPGNTPGGETDNTPDDTQEGGPTNTKGGETDGTSDTSSTSTPQPPTEGKPGNTPGGGSTNTKGGGSEPATQGNGENVEKNPSTPGAKPAEEGATATNVSLLPETKRYNVSAPKQSQTVFTKRDKGFQYKEDILADYMTYRAYLMKNGNGTVGGYKAWVKAQLDERLFIEGAGSKKLNRDKINFDLIGSDFAVNLFCQLKEIHPKLLENVIDAKELTTEKYLNATNNGGASAKTVNDKKYAAWVQKKLEDKNFIINGNNAVFAKDVLKCVYDKETDTNSLLPKPPYSKWLKTKLSSQKSYI